MKLYNRDFIMSYFSRFKWFNWIWYYLKLQSNKLPGILLDLVAALVILLFCLCRPVLFILSYFLIPIRILKQRNKVMKHIKQTDIEKVNNNVDEWLDKHNITLEEKLFPKKQKSKVYIVKNDID